MAARTAAMVPPEVPPLPRVLVAHPHVRCDVSVLRGSPHVAGSRVPVRRLWAWHRSGITVETLFRRYPNLSPAQILDALAFAYDNEELVRADVAREQALLEKQAPRGPEGPPLVPENQLSFPFDPGARR